ncbi:hypothetical protein CLU79DRAFT_685882, partial [Phycomyces nitens]
YHEPLEEPVPFEDFQFSFGLDPDFAMPIPLDILPIAPSDGPIPPEPFGPLAPALPTPSTVLNEDDQKTFSQFLDTFFMDHDTQVNVVPSHLPTAEEQEDAYRRTSILQSLDQQKQQKRANLLNVAQVKDTHAEHILRLRQRQRPKHRLRHSYSSKRSSNSNNSSSSSNSSKVKSKAVNHEENSEKTWKRNKTQKLHKELLTEEEKRANHIMSEQKRRSTIRTGFKDLTDIVPTLKNINNSKSTVLFKAVDYIRYLEKRNKNLREKIGGLEMRVDVEGRMGASGNTNMMAGRSHHPAALMAHKNQQKQLMALQEQLHLHQKLLAHQDI